MRVARTITAFMYPQALLLFFFLIPFLIIWGAIGHWFMPKPIPEQRARMLADAERERQLGLRPGAFDARRRWFEDALAWPPKR